MPNTTNSRRGRPALNNVRNLYEFLLEFSNRNESTPLAAINRRFGWTDGTSRSMVSQVRTQMNVRIRYNRYQQSFRLTAPASPRPVVATPAPADTLEILAREMNRETPEWAVYNCAHFIYNDGVDYNLYSASLQARIRAFRGGAIGNLDIAPPQESDFTIASNSPLTTRDEVIAALRATGHYFDAAQWRDWLDERTSGSRRGDSVFSFLTSPTFDSVCGRVRAWITTERIRIRSAVSAATVADTDSLWRGIAPEVASFYRERALDLRA